MATSGKLSVAERLHGRKEVVGRIRGQILPVQRLIRSLLGPSRLCRVAFAAQGKLMRRI
jgi:hypothetical protein